MKKRRRIVQRLFTTLLCLVLCAADIIPTGMTALAQEQEVQYGQEETDAADQKDPVSGEEMEAEEPAEDKPPAIKGDEESALPAEEEPESVPEEEQTSVSENAVEEEQDSVPENAVEEEQDSVPENTAEEEANVNPMMAASDGDIASGTYKVNGSDVSWIIDANGKLTVTGEGDFVDPSRKGNAREPWYSHRFEIKTAEISLTGVTNASYMFYNCTNLTSIDITNFDTSSVTDMGGMFYDCRNLTDLDVSKFNTDNVTDMSGMFGSCRNLNKLEVSKFNTDNVTDMSSMFRGCSSLTELEVSNFNTDNVTDMSSMFYDCRNLIELEVSNFNTDNVTNMSGMFYYCKNLAELDVSKFKTSKVEDMAYMFEGCSGLTALEVSDFDTSSVTNMRYMFKDCGKLSTLNVSNFNTKNVTKMDAIFYGCASLTALDLRCFVTSNITDMHDMFYNCSKLTKLDLSSEFHTGNVTNMSRMFRDCASLTTLDLRYFDTSSVTNMREMFSGCSKLIELDLNSFDTQNVTNITGIFDDCTDLNCIHTPCNLTQYVSLRSDFGDSWCRPDGTVMIELPRNLNYSIILTKGDIPTDTLSGISENISWEIDTDGNLTVSGTGDFEKRIDDVTKVKASPWYAYRTLIKTAEIDVKGMTDASYLFYECLYLTSIDLTNFDTNSVTSMDSMFCGCESLTEINLTNFRPYNVTNMASMFNGCKSLTSPLDLSNFYSNNVTDLSEMFYGCESLTELDVSNLETGSVTDMRNMFAGCTALYDLNLYSSNFTHSGNVTDMSGMFQGCRNLRNLNLTGLNTDSVTDMSNMFSGCRFLSELDLKDFNTNHVINMKDMFSGCKELEKLDLGSFNIGNVTDQESMFDFSDCENLTVIYTPCNLQHSVKLPVNGGAKWYRSDGSDVTELPQNLNYSIALKKNEAPTNIAEDTSGNVSWVIDANRKLTLSGTGDFERRNDRYPPWYNYCSSIRTAEVTVTDMTDTSGMFLRCEYLTSIDLTNFDTGKVTNMSEMFYGCGSLPTVDLKHFNTGNVTDMSRMFYICRNLTDIDLENFDTDKVTDMSGMFYACENLPELKLNNFKTGSVTDMSDMFGFCQNLTELKLSNFDTGNVTNMSGMFSECQNLTELDVKNFDTGNVTNMSGMFGDCKNLTKLVVSDFDTNNVTDMRHMFAGCTNLLTLNVSSFNTGNVTNMSNMFAACNGLTTLTLDRNRFDTGKVTDMSYMFSGCSNLTTLDVNRFDTGKVTDMNRMFAGCKNLITLDVSSFNTSSVTNMREMFEKCANLTTLDLSSFDVGSVTELESMFHNCSNLTKIHTPRNVTKFVRLPAEPGDTWHRSDGTVVTELPRNLNDSVVLGRNHTPTDPEKPDDPKEPEKPQDPEEPKDPEKPQDPENITSGKSGNISWEIDADGKLTVTGSGDYERTDAGSGSMRAPWYQARNAIKTAVINAIGMRDASYLFSDCENLTNIDLSNFDIGSVTDMNGMFSGCPKLTTIHTPRNVKQSVELPSAPGDKWYLPDGTVVTELPRNLDVSVVLIKNQNPNEGKPDDTPDDDPKGDNDSDVPDEDIPEDGKIPEGLWISAIADQTYTGTEIKPEVRVYEGKARLKHGIDYTLSYKNNTKAAQAGDDKPPTVVVKGRGNYSGTETKTFTITKCDISDTYVTKTFTDAYAPLANGKNPTLVFTSKYNNKALKKNTDYTLTVKNNAGNEVTSYGAEGIYLAVVKGAGNYTGECSFPFEVLNKVPVSRLKIGKIAPVNYDGNSKTPEPAVKYGKVTLTKDTDYSLSYLNNTAVGTATIVITGMGDYFGTRNVTFSIAGLQIRKAKFSGFQSSYPYTGDKVYQNGAVLKYEENKLTEGTDYTVSYSNCLNKGKATVTYTGIGKYAGSIKKTYNITAYNIAADTQKRIKLSTDAISAAYAKGGARPSLKVYDGTRLLTEGTDYTLSYQNNTAITTSATAKQPTITVKGTGNYAGTFSEKKTFTITAKDIAEVTATAPDVAAGTTAGKYKSTPVLTDTDGKKLKAGTDYDKAYTYTYKNTTEKVLNNGAELTRNAGDPVDTKDIVPVGTVLCVCIKAKEGGSYTGETTAEYRIASSLINKAKITVQNPAQNNKNLFPYTGQAIRLEKSSLTVKVGAEVLSGDQYEILEDTYKNNVRKGTASVQIRGVGNYGGTATVKFKIGTKGFQWVKRMFG